MRKVVTLAVLAVALTGCFRTIYRNLHGSDAPPVETDVTLAAHSKGSWQSFFLWGWLPHPKEVDAAAQCGGEAHVATIETQNSFGTGFVGAIAGYYINVYSPWRGHVTCDHPR